MQFGVWLDLLRTKMKIPADLRTVLLGLAFTSALFGQVDAREIIRNSVAADEHNWRIARNYGFLRTGNSAGWTPGGGLKSSEVKTYDITLQEGTPYRQLVKRDDRPLPAKQEKKEQDTLAKSITERPERPRRSEPRGCQLTRGARIGSVRPGRVAGCFRVQVGRRREAGRPQRLHNRGNAAPGIPASIPTAKLFRSLKGRFWVDQQDHQLVKVEAEVIDTISVGLFLVRVAKGSRATLELTLRSDGVWLPDRLPGIRVGPVGTANGPSF